METIAFIMANLPVIGQRMLEHVSLVGVSVGVAILTGVPVSAPAEIGHRACSTCLLHWTAMKTGRRLKWDPKAERFIGDDAANAMLIRPQRAKYAI